ncbi:MAG: hypothetical protein WD397_07565 [Wenzhouxiangellaceae bacterium]
MHNPIPACALALTAAAMLGGCAANPECTEALETADAAARDRLPPGQWLPGVDAACASQAEQAWADALLADCAAVYGFHVAYSGSDRPAQCRNADFDSAWNLGEMLSEMERESASIQTRLEDDSIPRDVRRDLQRRLVVIERDLPQLEALARMDGYLPPAEVPDSD